MMTTSYSNYLNTSVFFSVYDYHLYLANSLAFDIRISGYYHANIHHILGFVQQSTCPVS